jgi:hypothetical protein
VSRATVYRVFPGARTSCCTRSWRGRWVASSARSPKRSSAPRTSRALVEDGLLFAHAAVGEHVVLQKILVTEPERLLPLLTTEQDRPLMFITGYLVPFLEREERDGRLKPGLDQALAADFVARMLLSLIGSDGAVIEDPIARRRLVREQLLVGVLTPEALATG